MFGAHCVCQLRIAQTGNPKSDKKTEIGKVRKVRRGVPGPRVHVMPWRPAQNTVLLFVVCQEEFEN